MDQFSVTSALHSNPWKRLKLNVSNDDDTNRKRCAPFWVLLRYLYGYFLLLYIKDLFIKTVVLYELLKQFSAFLLFSISFRNPSIKFYHFRSALSYQNPTQKTILMVHSKKLHTFMVTARTHSSTCFFFCVICFFLFKKQILFQVLENLLCQKISFTFIIKII